MTPSAVSPDQRQDQQVRAIEQQHNLLTYLRPHQIDAPPQTFVTTSYG